MYSRSHQLIRSSSMGFGEQRSFCGSDILKCFPSHYQDDTIVYYLSKKDKGNSKKPVKPKASKKPSKIKPSVLEPVEEEPPAEQNVLEETNEACSPLKEIKYEPCGHENVDSDLCDRCCPPNVKVIFVKKQRTQIQEVKRDYNDPSRLELFCDESPPPDRFYLCSEPNKPPQVLQPSAPITPIGNTNEFYFRPTVIERPYSNYSQPCNSCECAIPNYSQPSYNDYSYNDMGPCCESPTRRPSFAWVDRSQSRFDSGSVLVSMKPEASCVEWPERRQGSCHCINTFGSDVSRMQRPPTRDASCGSLTSLRMLPISGEKPRRRDNACNVTFQNAPDACGETPQRKDSFSQYSQRHDTKDACCGSCTCVRVPNTNIVFGEQPQKRDSVISMKAVDVNAASSQISYGSCHCINSGRAPDVSIEKSKSQVKTAKSSEISPSTRNKPEFTSSENITAANSWARKCCCDTSNILCPGVIKRSEYCICNGENVKPRYCYDCAEQERILANPPVYCDCLDFEDPRYEGRMNFQDGLCHSCAQEEEFSPQRFVDVPTEITPAVSATSSGDSVKKGKKPKKTKSTQVSPPSKAGKGKKNKKTKTDLVLVKSSIGPDLNSDSDYEPYEKPQKTRSRYRRHSSHGSINRGLLKFVKRKSDDFY